VAMIERDGARDGYRYGVGWASLGAGRRVRVCGSCCWWWVGAGGDELRRASWVRKQEDRGAAARGEVQDAREGRVVEREGADRVDRSTGCHGSAGGHGCHGC